MKRTFSNSFSSESGLFAVLFERACLFIRGREEMLSVLVSSVVVVESTRACQGFSHFDEYFLEELKHFILVQFIAVEG